MKMLLVAAGAILAVAVGCRAAVATDVDDGNGRPAVLVNVQLDQAVKFSNLKPSDKLHGTVKRDVYAGDRAVIPAGSPVDLTVVNIERRRRPRTDRWPWAIRLFVPRHINYPSSLSAVVSLPDGSSLPLPVSLVMVAHEVSLTEPSKGKAQRKDAKHAPHANGEKAADGPALVLAADSPIKGASNFQESDSGSPTEPGTVAAGTVAHVVLLGGLRASKSHAGDAFTVRLAEPVRVDSKVVLPEGVLIRGRVVRSVPPRWLSRPASLSLSFTQVKLPAGGAATIVASPSAAVVDRTSGLRMDSEGSLKAASTSRARLLMDLGVAGGIAKVTDDTFQLIAEALVSTATDASTAGSAKIIAAAVSGFYLLTRHGRDVSLPAYTRMDISFDRPALLQARTTP